MPAPEMTQELKNDLQILQMRSTLDRTHYYKSSDWKKLPKYFQVHFNGCGLLLVGVVYRLGVS